MNIELDYDLRDFLSDVDISATYQTCAECNKSDIRKITIALHKYCLHINTFCSDVCIKAGINALFYSDRDIVYLIVDCDSFFDAYNKKQEIHECIKELKKVQLLL